VKLIQERICKEIVVKGRRENILNIINELLENSIEADKLELLIEIYIHHDKYSDDKLFLKFKQAIENYYKEEFDSKKCLAYLLKEEIRKILDKKYRYFDGFENILKIVKLYNRHDNLTKEEEEKFIYGDLYAETISYKLSDILSDFDLTKDVIYSELDKESRVIDKINNLYKYSKIDDSLKEVLLELSLRENKKRKV